MSFNSIGDLANNLLLSQAGVKSKNNIVTLSSELVSGLTSDVRGRLRNDLSKQTDWNYGISTNQVLEKTLGEALTRAQAKQLALGAISENSMSIANDVSVALGSNANIATGTLSQKARNGLEQTISHLNTQIMGQSIFSGAAFNRPAMASVEEIITSVKVYIGAVNSATEIVQSVRDWMEDPLNGYQRVAFLGTQESNSPIRLSNTRSILEPTKADSSPLKDIVENFILATLAGDESFSLPASQQEQLLQTSSDGLRGAESKTIEIQANLGFVESEITKAKAFASAEIHTFERLRVDVLGISEFETASKLQEAELQLEKIYALTARSARMSLLEYMQ